MWSRFWYCSDTAGPGLLDVARIWDREPRILRPVNRSPPAPWIHENTYISPTYLNAGHASQVAEFWRAHYGGSDWWLDASDEWVRSVLASSETIALGVIEKGTNQLLGTILSRPAVKRGAYILLGDHAFLHDARVIEGLCIHPAQRGRHLAGWLIAWMDFLTHNQKPVAHFWFREVPIQAPTTEIARATWGYVRIAELPTSSPLSESISVSIEEFSRWWSGSAPTWRHATGIVGSQVDIETGEEFWRIRRQGNAIVVFQNTRRKSRPDNLPIWEVAWCGELRGEGLLYPGLGTEARTVIESMAKGTIEGLLFVTDEPHHGGASLAWVSESGPWKWGTSGMHLTYIYNYMPPAFWRCDVHLLRTEI